MLKTDLVLHIGSHKTGSTAIQNSLYDNREFLKHHGFYYGSFYEPWKSHHNFSFGLLKDGLEYEGVSFNKDVYQFAEIATKPHQVIQEIKNAINNSNYNTVIISSEELFGVFLPLLDIVGNLTLGQRYHITEYIIIKLKELLEGFNVKIALYLRRQDIFIESIYNQMCKFPLTADKEILKFDDFIKRALTPLDYYAILSIWAKHFGSENITICPYEKSQIPNGVLYHFYSTHLGLESDEIKCLNHPIENNSSRLSRDIIEYKRLIGIKVLDHEFVKISGVVPEEDMIFFSQSDREGFLNSYQEGNSRIAQEYLGKESLFNEKIKQYKPYEGLQLGQTLDISYRLINCILDEKKEILDYRDKLERDINEVKVACEKLTMDLAEIRGDRDNLATRLKEVMAAKNEELSMLNDALDKVINSKSWLITKPFRHICRLITSLMKKCSGGPV